MRAATSTFMPSAQPFGPSGRKTLRRMGRSIVTGLALATISPLLLVICIAIRLQTGQTAFCLRNRINEEGRPCQLYRFRTMTEARDRTGNLLPAYQRVHELGLWLHATRLHKAPTLWNIVTGDVESL